MPDTPDPESVALLRQLSQDGLPESEAVRLRQELYERYLSHLEAGTFGGVTSTGLPYPEPDDPVALGADAIRALAEAIKPGRVRLTPGNVSGGTIGADGVVTVAGQSAVNIGAIFTAAYRDYAIEIDLVNASAPADFLLQFINTDGSVELATEYEYNQLQSAPEGLFNSTREDGIYIPFGRLAPRGMRLAGEFQDPARIDRFSWAFSRTMDTDRYQRFHSGFLSINKAVTGIRLSSSPSTVTFTGDFRIYGVN